MTRDDSRARTTEKLSRDFFARATPVVARDLLGRVLVSQIGGEHASGRIVECEVYTPRDSTSHAFRGRTPRNASMFMRPGTLFVYFTYGMHFCLNLVTEPEGIGAAVLVRALVPLDGVAVMQRRRGAHAAVRDLCRGPARLCVALGVDRASDGVDLCARGAVVHVEAGTPIARSAVRRGPRVGVAGIERDIRAPLRFYVADEAHVSNGPRNARAPAREIV